MVAAAGENLRMRSNSRRSEASWRAVIVTSLVVFNVLAAASCSLIAGSVPPNAEPFTPPAVYARWWAMTEACSGRSGNLGDVHWYRIPGSSFRRGRQMVSGYTNRFVNRVLLAAKVAEDGPAVRHEMLH